MIDDMQVSGDGAEEANCNMRTPDDMATGVVLDLN